MSSARFRARLPQLYRRKPLLVGLFLVALFIWIAENLETLTETWRYPHQFSGWSVVSLGKLGSWFLLLLISYALVAAVNRWNGSTLRNNTIYNVYVMIFVHIIIYNVLSSMHVCTNIAKGRQLLPSSISSMTEGANWLVQLYPGTRASDSRTP